MDSPIPSMFGFDRSCGDFQVVVLKNRDKSGGIAVEYRRSVESDEQSSHRASVPWKGGEVVDAQVKSLLDDAQVPIFIQESVWSCLFKAAHQASREKEHQVPSVLIKICTDMQLLDSDYESEPEEE